VRHLSVRATELEALHQGVFGRAVGVQAGLQLGEQVERLPLLAGEPLLAGRVGGGLGGGDGVLQAARAAQGLDRGHPSRGGFGGVLGLLGGGPPGLGRRQRALRVAVAQGGLEVTAGRLERRLGGGGALGHQGSLGGRRRGGRGSRSGGRSRSAQGG
jgi:hypothetical protein